MGKRGTFRGNLQVDPSEEGIVEIIQNLVDFALEGHLTEDQLRQGVGIVVGFALSHPHVFQASRQVSYTVSWTRDHHQLEYHEAY